MNKEITIDGKKIFYRVYGNGKPVMLVHGFGETGDVWKNQASLNPSKGGTLAHTQNQIAENSLLEEKISLSESQVSPLGGDLRGPINSCSSSLIFQVADNLR